MLSTAARALTILLLCMAHAAAAPRVTVQYVEECSYHKGCHFTPWADKDGLDAARITVKGITPKPIRELYHSDYGPDGASLVRDAKGTWYVLLPYRIGHGTSFSVTAYLGVLRVEGSRLHFARRALTRYWTSDAGGADYDFDVASKPREGGLVIRLRRQLWGSRDRDPIASPRPPRVKYLRVR